MRENGMFDTDVKEQNCLACIFYRLTDVAVGNCKEDKTLRPNYPVKNPQECCDKWQDAGQQYYIRLGWLKNKKKELQA